MFVAQFFNSVPVIPSKTPEISTHLWSNFARVVTEFDSTMDIRMFLIGSFTLPEEASAKLLG